MLMGQNMCDATMWTAVLLACEFQRYNSTLSSINTIKVVTGDRKNKRPVVSWALELNPAIDAGA